MGQPELNRLWNGPDKLGESPIWDHRTDRFFWVDIENPHIHCLQPDTGNISSMMLPEMVGSIGLYGQTGLIAAIGQGFQRVDFDRQILEPLGEGDVEPKSCLMNDGKADRQGRFLAGAKDLAESNPLASAWLFSSGKTQHALEGFTVFNGPAFSPKGDFVYFTDSPGRVIFKADYDCVTGTIDNKQVFATLADGTGYPDGMTVDSEGCLWNAHWDGWRLTRYLPDGTIDRIVEMPVRRPTSLAFGGEDLKTVYVTTASTRLSEAELAENPEAGSLYSFRSDIPGLPEPIVKD